MKKNSQRLVTRALWKGVNVISVLSLVFSTSFAGLTIAPKPLHAGEIKGVNFSGTKFNDLNGNGTWDNGEPGLAGWTIDLWVPCLASVLDYTHDNVLNLDDSTIFTTNYEAGDLTADANGDGVVNAADLACANDAYADGVLTLSPSGILSTRVTDANGNFDFSGLPFGTTYWLSEEAQAGWTQTTTPTMYGPFTDTGSEGIIFGNFHDASISGMKFQDMNANAAKDPGEPGLKNWTIQLWTTCDTQRADYDHDNVVTLADAVLFTTPYANHDNAADIHADSVVNVTDYDCMKALVNQNPSSEGWYVIRTTLTDAAGNYSFTDVPAGDYRVDEVQKAGWTKTLPSGDWYDVALVSNGNVTDKDFGNFHNGSIAGMKFNDHNGNGAKDEGDAGLANWTIDLWTQCSVARADYNHDGDVTLADAVLFTSPYMANDLAADVRVDSAVNPMDKGCMDALVNGAASDGDWVVIQTTTTDSNGNYIFSGLLSGDYRVSEEQQIGWTKTLPAGDYYAVTLASDENVLGKDFGNTQPPRGANLTISKTDNRETAKAGEVLHYAITINNDTEVDATNVKVTDTLPNNISLVTNISDGNQFGGVINWPNLTIPADSNKVLTYDATIDPNLPTGDYVLHNVATLGCGSPISTIALVPSCTYEGSNFDDTSVSVINTQPTITLAKTAATTTAAGGNLTYTLTYTVANASVTNLTLVDPLPTGTTFVSASDSATYTAATNTVTWMLGTKAPGTGTVTVTLKTPAPIANGSVLTNTASLDADQTDPVSAAQATTLNSAPLLAIEKTANVAVANPGNTITYTVKVTNNGTDSANNVMLNDVLPTGFITLDSGASNLTINLGTIAAGASVSTTYQTTTSTTLTDGSYTNVATASAANATAITAQADVILRTPAVLGAETAGPQPQVLGAESSLPDTGTGVADYMIALFGIVALAAGIRLTRQSIKE